MRRVRSWRAAGLDGGLGAAWIGVAKWVHPKAAPMHFAKAIAMINYSKKLKIIKYDEMGGVIQYEFESSLLRQKQPIHSILPNAPLPQSHLAISPWNKEALNHEQAK